MVARSCLPLRIFNAPPQFRLFHPFTTQTNTMRGLFGAVVALSSVLGASAALTKCQVVDLLRSAGVSSAYLAKMTCTAFYES